MGSIKKTEEIEIEKLIPYANNAKIHGAAQLEKLKKSIERFGFITPCLIDKDFNLIAGHGRLMAAKELHLQKVPCIYVEGLSESQRKAYILADNKLGEIAEWDMELLDQEIRGLTEAGFDITLTGFDFDNQLSEEIKEGVEIELDSLGDETFKHECPECGFKFN